MQQLSSTSQTADPDSSQRRPDMTPWEKRQVFREMVVLQLRNGQLSSWRRRQLVQYAAGLGLTPVQAGRLVDEARARVCVHQPSAATGLTYVAAPRPDDVPNWAVGIGLLALTAAFNAWVFLSMMP